MKDVDRYLDSLNKTYFSLHKAYEDLFWLSYMGDHSVNKKKDAALKKRDQFRSNPKFLGEIGLLLEKADIRQKERLSKWVNFFERYQTPKEAGVLKQKIDKLESDIHTKLAKRKEGYIDPYSKKFVEASSVQIRTMIGTNPDEKIRKACFDAKEKMASSVLKEYIKVIGLRNQYAKILGFADFYDFKVQREDGMTKKELFSIFDSIYEKTKYAKKNVIEMEKKMPGLRKPWNFGYMMSGDFTKEEDPYFQFDEALTRWGKSFSAMGIDFKEGKLKLDLLSRKGKYNNGFCHWPDMVSFVNGKRKAGSSNFTCNVVFGQIGSGDEGYNTLFHEGGHAAHLLNSEERDVCVNHEYSPMSTSWAETQSMFLDTVFSSVEWNSRYSVNKDGEKYPFDLFERRVKKLHVLRPLALNGIIFISNFEKEIYESKNLSEKKVKELAVKNYRRFFERSEDSLSALNTPHIYSWESSASYHGYGLAELAVYQWRNYFYKKYGYIVDNPNIGREMKEVWKFAGSKTFDEFVLMATEKKLGPEAYLEDATKDISEIIKTAKAKIGKLNTVPEQKGKIDLNADIRMVHGKKEISNNKKSFEEMAEKYKKWLKTQKIKN